MFAGRGRFVFPWRAGRRRDRRDDTGSMPLAMLVVLVGVSLSAGLSGLVIGQIKDSRRLADRVAAVHAAQAGLDAGLARIRAATGGLLTQLPPCDQVIQQQPGQPAYRTSIGYFLVDPSGLANTLGPVGDLTNLNPLTAGTPATTLLAGLGKTVAAPGLAALQSAAQGAVGCANGVLKQVPLFGLLRSVGTAGAATRTLYATYQFRTTEETIPGGHVVINGTSGQLCIGAGSGSGQLPKAGDPVRAVPCAGADDYVKFIYPRNITLSLSKSRTSKVAGIPYGLCVTAVVQVQNAPVTFAPCSAVKVPAQQWQYEVNQQTYYGTLDGVKSSNFCLAMDQPGVVNTAIVLKSGGSNCGKANVAGRSFVPEANVGSGAAGINTGQLVNYAEVGRCLDLTNEDPTGKWFTDRKLAPALITYPCKQSFTGTVFWNHKWTAPAFPPGRYEVTGQISTTPTQDTYKGKSYCLNSPGAVGGYVWVALCSLGGSNQQWTVFAAAPLDAEAYRVVDAYGNCLEAGGSLGPAYQYSGWSEVITAKCDGSGIQKWNAPRTLGLGPLTGIQER